MDAKGNDVPAGGDAADAADAADAGEAEVYATSNAVVTMRNLNGTNRWLDDRRHRYIISQQWRFWVRQARALLLHVKGKLPPANHQR
mmetsp:Transcript_467/g.1401  ORF Transcript_467/g.1401 Transcript_467/m.1401 type:complete len:87 (+) Transcript_467:547-807(+)